MIELVIIHTGKSFNPKDKFCILYDSRKSFNSKTEAMTWLRSEYGKSKRSAMYVDDADGKPQQIGYVIGFRNSDLSHYPVQHWIQQDWIEFRECKLVNLEKVKS